MFDEEDDSRNRHLSLGEGVSKRQAEKYLKANLQYMQMKRNRLRVLASQAQHHNLRSKYQTQKIEKHLQIQEETVESRERVAESLHARNRVQFGRKSKKKQKQERQKMSQFLHQLKQQKMHQSQLLKQSSKRNSQFLARRKQKYLQDKRSKREKVMNMQTNARQVVCSYNRQKLQDISNIKLKEKLFYLDYSSEVMKQYQVLVQKQKQLIELSQESISNSRLLNQHFKNLYIQKSNSHFQLPLLKKPTDNCTIGSN